MLKFGRVFRTKGGKLGRYLYRHGKKVAFVALAGATIDTSREELAFTTEAKNWATTATGWAVMELLEHIEDQKRLSDK